MQFDSQFMTLVDDDTDDPTLGFRLVNELRIN